MWTNLLFGTSVSLRPATSTTISVMAKQMTIQNTYCVTGPNTNAESNECWRCDTPFASSSKGFTLLPFPLYFLTSLKTPKTTAATESATASARTNEVPGRARGRCKAPP